MNNVVLVFVFPEPEGGIELALVIEEARSLFKGRDDLKAYAGINTVAEKVIGIFEGEDEEEGNLVRHARAELARINNDEDFNNSLIESVRAFAKYGHSGGSASVAIPILHDLLQFKNLTPLTDDASEWNNVGQNTWQSTRNSEAFSNDRGKTYWLLSEGASSVNPNPTHYSESAKD